MKKFFYIQKLFIINQNNIILGRWCSTNKINKERVSNIILNYSNYDNCYVNTFENYKLDNIDKNMFPKF